MPFSSEGKPEIMRAEYAPKAFNSHQYRAISKLCDLIIPADAHCGGAVEAGAPEFIDLLASESTRRQVRLTEGLAWLDAFCQELFHGAFLDCSPESQKHVLDLIAYHANAESDARLSQGIDFFTVLRALTTDGFFTSRIGTEYLQYIGNEVLDEFPGCPPLPDE